VVQVSRENFGSTSAGRPAGISPITGTENPAATDSAVIEISATSGAGTMRLTTIGVRNTTSKVRKPSSSASPSSCGSSPGKPSTAASGEDCGAAPSSGAVCSSTMITPTPLMKPDTTG